MRKGLIKGILEVPLATLLVFNLSGFVITEFRLNKLYWNEDRDKGRKDAHDQAELILKNISPLEYPFKMGEALSAYKYHHAIENGWFKKFSSP